MRVTDGEPHVELAKVSRVYQRRRRVGLVPYGIVGFAQPVTQHWHGGEIAVGGFVRPRQDQ
jgi:hypothetical protein